MRLVWAREKVHSSFGQPGMLCGPLFVVVYAHSSRVPTGRVIFEIGGAPVREELARDGTVMLLLGHLST